MYLISRSHEGQPKKRRVSYQCSAILQCKFKRGKHSDHMLFGIKAEIFEVLVQEN